MKRLDILIADDHKLVRHGIRYTLKLNNPKDYFGCIHQASTGKETIIMARRRAYDLILLDITFPDISGIEVAAEILRRKPDTKIISLTMHDGEFEIRAMIKTGVKGYLLKNTTPEVLNQAIKAVMKGKNFYSKEVALILNADIAAEPENGYPLDFVLTQRITKRQRQILTMMATGMTNEEISKTIGLHRRTVDGHRQRLLERFNVKKTTELIFIASKLGYV